MVAAPPRHRELRIERRGTAPLVEAGQRLTVLVWNIQFAGSRERVFFYDGGDAVHVEADVVHRTLDRIVDVLRRVNADVVLLQEVDRGSDRTARIDQHLAMVESLDYPCDVSAAYFRNPFVPHPPHEPLGRVDMHLTALSRYRIDAASRWQLPLLRESWLRQQFNLRRALLQLDLPRVAGGAMRLFSTHLSAFSHGDGTLPRQVGHLLEHIARADADAVPWLLAGDFNALPPGDPPARLGEAAKLYPEHRSPVAVLFEAYQSAIPAEAHRQEPERYRTLLPPGSDQADRAIDHVFVTPGTRILDAQVLGHVTDASDHLPILVTLEVPRA